MDRTEAGKSRILSFYRTYGRWPTGSACRSTSERTLATLFLRYVERDPVFAAKVKKMGWVSRDERVAARKDAVLAFQEAHDRWPSQHATNRREELLGKFFQRAMCPKATMYDPSFAREALKRGYEPREHSSLAEEFPYAVPPRFAGIGTMPLKKAA